MRKYHKDGTLPTENEIFVFGSNEAGIHGAGAAKVAREKFGAIWGEGVGITGNCYAIPTKDKVIDTLLLDCVRNYIEEFVEFSKEYPEVQFFVTRVGCGLAGFIDADIAPLFKQCGDNCSFAEEWREYLD